MKMPKNKFRISLFIIAVLFQEYKTQDEDEEGPYRGALIGKLKSYHHQVSGEVYAVDDHTLLLVDFNYDGTGDDAFFWAGDTLRAGPQGFIVPDEHGKTNVLERYINAEVRLSLPEGRQISRLKWFSVYDIASQNVFGDVDVPEGWVAPAPLVLPALAADGGGVSSGPVVVLDDATILIKELQFDGGGETYFWAGAGPQPSARGFKIPDEHGYLEPLRAYSGAEVRLSLPGGRAARSLRWLALWDAAAARARAWVSLPARARVPPAAARPLPPRAAAPHCRQLHARLQLAWDVFGNQLTVQLIGKIGPRDYMAFGISGSANSSRMAGADVVVTHFDERTQRGFADDYNITDIAPCVQVLGAWRGVCRDVVVGGTDSAQLLAAERRDGITSVTYRRTLQPGEPLDREFSSRTWAVWAAGPLSRRAEPAHHSLTQRADLLLQLAPAAPADDCFPFTTAPLEAPAAWDVVELADPAVRVFDFRLGPAGGARGLRGRGLAPPDRAWYVRGWLAPTLQLRRGLTYSFLVFGGKDPHSAAHYHPLVVTPSPDPDVDRLSEAAVPLLGLRPTRRGRLAATAAGDLCEAAPPAASADDFPTFRQYNRTLQWRCEGAQPHVLTVAPDQHWPDTVYYHSYTAHRDMGGKINIVDRYRRGAARSRAARPPGPAPAAAPAAAAAAALLLAARHL